MPRNANKMDDTLASLVSTLALQAKEDMTIQVCGRVVILPDDENSEENVNAISVLKMDEGEWR